MILLINSQKLRKMFKVKCCSKGCLFSYVPCNFRQVFFYCLMTILMIYIQTGGYIYKADSVEIPFAANCLRKE